jgi:hypothetical protein
VTGRVAALAVLVPLTGLAGAFLGKYQSVESGPGVRARAALKVSFPVLLACVIVLGARSFPWYGAVALVAVQMAVVSLFRRFALTAEEHAASDSASRRALEERIEAARGAGDRRQEEALRKLKDRLGKWL